MTRIVGKMGTEQCSKGQRGQCTLSTLAPIRARFHPAGCALVRDLLWIDKEGSRYPSSRRLIRVYMTS